MEIVPVKEPEHLFTRPFANDGTKNILMDTSDTSKGCANLIDGFPQSTQLPIQQGGAPPQRADFNGLYYMMSAFCYWMQSGGQFTYKHSLPYAKNCLVIHDNLIYMCVKENGVNTSAGIRVPATDDAVDYWIEQIRFIGSLNKTEIDNVIDNGIAIIGNSLSSCQTITKTFEGVNASLSFIAAVPADVINIVADTAYGEYPRNWEIANNINVYHNDVNVGTLITKSYMYYADYGRGGFGWGYYSSTTGALAIKRKVNKGDIIKVVSANGSYIRYSSISVTLSL